MSGAKMGGVRAPGDVSGLLAASQSGASESRDVWVPKGGLGTSKSYFKHQMGCLDPKMGIGAATGAFEPRMEHLDPQRGRLDPS